MSQTSVHPCGCVTGPDPAFGVTRSLEKCPGHVAERAAQPTGEAYYRSIGILDAKGAVREDHYCDELLEGIGQIPPPAGECPLAVEVGCGLSPYVRLVRAAGYAYMGIEPDPWAAAEMGRRFGAAVVQGTWEQFRSKLPADLLLCCHALEHMPDAPAALGRFHEMLVPGGHLVLLVPDDTDLVNPDHLWFFSPESLYSLLTLVGFTVPTISVHKRIERENFIYCVARKRDTDRG